MKAIEVAAAVIIEQNRVFAAQRGAYGPLGGKWEFPGGKLERGERAQDAVVRELFEELGTTVIVRHALVTVHHQYPWFAITMHALLCERIAGDLILTEHQESRWLRKSELYTLDWAERTFRCSHMWRSCSMDDLTRSLQTALVDHRIASPSHLRPLGPEQSTEQQGGTDVGG